MDYEHVKAYARRWRHCLARSHRSVTLRDCSQVVYIGCECGDAWLNTRPEFSADILAAWQQFKLAQSGGDH